MRPGTLRAYAFGVFTGSVMTATLTMCAAPARADGFDDAYLYADAVCTVLQDHPTYSGLIGIGQALNEDYGYTTFDAGQIIAWSVFNECQQFIPLIRAFAQTGAQTATAIT